MNCIDVSEWNGDIDWNAVKEAGVEYALIRCGFGKQGIDKYFNINIEEARAAGIKIGIYYYSYATDYDSAVAEAKHCIELIEDYRADIDLPVWYDVEEERNIPNIVDVCHGFINTMNYYGYNCGVYTPVSWFDAYFKDISCDYFWMASWGNDDGQPHTKPQWCDIWQYTSKGSVNGVGNGCVDCDILYNEDMKLLIKEEQKPPEKKIVNIIIEAEYPEDVEVNIKVYKKEV